jgi:hypothetical protein
MHGGRKAERRRRERESGCANCQGRKTRSMPNLLASRSMYILLVCRSVCVCMLMHFCCCCMPLPCTPQKRDRTRRGEKQGTTLSTLLQCDLNVLSLPITFQALSTRQHSGWGPSWQALALAHTDQITMPLCLQEYLLLFHERFAYYLQLLAVAACRPVPLECLPAGLHLH